MVREERGNLNKTQPVRENSSALSLNQNSPAIKRDSYNEEKGVKREKKQKRKGEKKKNKKKIKLTWLHLSHSIPLLMLIRDIEKRLDLKRGVSSIMEAISGFVIGL